MIDFNCAARLVHIHTTQEAELETSRMYDVLTVGIFENPRPQSIPEPFRRRRSAEYRKVQPMEMVLRILNGRNFQKLDTVRSRR